jgi:hypothetical protein
MTLTEILFIIGFALSFIVVLKSARQRAKNVANPHAARLQRIHSASCWVQFLMVIGFVLSCYSLLAFFMGWPFFSEPRARMVISHSHIYTAPADMPDSIFYLWLVQILWGGFGFWVVFALFGLYRQGILFSARNVRHIRSLGYYLIVNWAIEYQMQGALRDMDLSTNSLFVGLLIIFVSWIMDEGRKIREEQELTV